MAPRQGVPPGSRARVRTRLRARSLLIQVVARVSQSRLIAPAMAGSWSRGGPRLTDAAPESDPLLHQQARASCNLFVSRIQSGNEVYSARWRLKDEREQTSSSKAQPRNLDGASSLPRMLPPSRFCLHDTPPLAHLVLFKRLMGRNARNRVLQLVAPFPQYRGFGCSVPGPEWGGGGNSALQEYYFKFPHHLGCDDLRRPSPRLATR